MKKVGEHHPNAKLRNRDIPGIREKLAHGYPYGRLAREHGVDRTTIRQIRDGITWRAVQ